MMSDIPTADERTFILENPVASTIPVEHPSKYICCLTQSLMLEPVACSDGQIYEHDAIKAWFVTKNTSPIARTTLKDLNLYPLYQLRQEIDDYVLQNKCSEDRFVKNSEESIFKQHEQDTQESSLQQTASLITESDLLNSDNISELSFKSIVLLSGILQLLTCCLPCIICYIRRRRPIVTV